MRQSGPNLTSDRSVRGCWGHFPTSDVRVQATPTAVVLLCVRRSSARRELPTAHRLGCEAPDRSQAGATASLMSRRGRCPYTASSVLCLACVPFAPRVPHSNTAGVTTAPESSSTEDGRHSRDRSGRRSHAKLGCARPHHPIRISRAPSGSASGRADTVRAESETHRMNVSSDIVS